MSVSSFNVMFYLTLKCWMLPVCVPCTTSLTHQPESYITQCSRLTAGILSKVAWDKISSFSQMLQINYSLVKSVKGNLPRQV